MTDVSSAAELVICDLKCVDEHFATVADRLWNAWWKGYGEALSDVEAALREVMEADAFPFTLVALQEGAFIGTVTGIQTDIHERPNLGPCLAALWVEPEARGHGVAAKLMSAVIARFEALGFDEVYLSAKPHLQGFYSAKGWGLIESDVGDEQLLIFRRDLKGEP